MGARDEILPDPARAFSTRGYAGSLTSVATASTRRGGDREASHVAVGHARRRVALLERVRADAVGSGCATLPAPASAPSSSACA